MDGSKKVKTRIAVISHMEPAGGGSFQYGVAILESMMRLPQDQYEICFWYSSSSLDGLVEGLPYRHVKPKWFWMVQLHIFKKIARIINKILKNKTIETWIKHDWFVQAVRKWKPDVCISLEQSYNPLSKIVRVIGPVHDLMHRYERSFPEVGSPEEYAARERLFRNHVKYAAAVLVDSEEGKKHVMESYGPTEDKIHILPFVASPLLAEPVQPSRVFAIEGKPFIFYPAQFWPHKNHLAVIHAMSMLPESLSLHCVFAGSTDKAAYDSVIKAVKLAGLSERVHILGYISDAEVAWLYKNAFALVMPTFFGPTNIPPLEAMQYGCPVIVSGIYGMPERYGDAALYVDPKRPEQIATLLCRLAEEPELRSALIKRGYAQLARWTKEDFQKKFLEILLSVCASTPRPL